MFSHAKYFLFTVCSECVQFAVTAAPPPVVSLVSPGSLGSNTNTQVTITGTNFRTNATVSMDCKDAITSSSYATRLGTVTTVTATSITGILPSSGLDGAVCVVTVSVT